MGQYYRGVILSKHTNKAKKIIVKQSFCCYAHDNGAKLMEHSYVGNWYVKEYERALAEEFYGYPLVWSGDYADTHFDTDVYSKALEFVDKATRKNAKALGYRKNKNGRWGDEFIRDGITASEKSLAIATPYEELTTTYEYIINFTKKMFVRIPKKTGNGLLIHPLPLLCADGNGRGGGDYEGTNMELIGAWAFDRIGVANELPKNIKTELVVEFKECYDGGDSSVNDFSFIPRK
jgi:hypothetical protein